MLDLNVLLDVIQNRQPHYLDSASVLSAARSGEFVAAIPVHAYFKRYRRKLVFEDVALLVFAVVPVIL